MLTPDQPAPEDYYQNNCRTLLRFVHAQSRHLLDDSELHQIEAFLGTTDDAQRLFARLLTRKGPLYRLDSLNYREVGDTASALAELSALGLVQSDAVHPADQVLHILRKHELVRMCHDKRSLSRFKKTELTAFILGTYPDPVIVRRGRALAGWCSVARPDVWTLVRLLYFGDRIQDWSAFVLRDLGMVTYEQVEFSRPVLRSRSDLIRDLMLRSHSTLSRRVDDFPTLGPELRQALINAHTDNRFAKRRQERALLRLGAWEERQGRLEDAILTYDSVRRHPARERIVRVLDRLGDETAVQAVLEEIRQTPISDEEAQFAQRFRKRRAGFQPKTTVIDIDAVESSVEIQALEILTRQGGWGAHVESRLINSLTGLMYWPVIFSGMPGAFTNPFQTGPNDLYYDDFAVARRDAIEDLEGSLEDNSELRRHLLDIADRKQDVACSLVSWKLLGEVGLENVLAAMPVEHIRRICAFLIRNLHQRRAGLPDLFVTYSDGTYELVEVKGPNDQLQPGQRVWFRHMHELGIPSRVLKLKLRSSD